ncbi:hypothetical protein [Mycobacteroides abscessus]|uniref:hypothetical protein n=1 Tax=Mycobacteroides abscessus TaxID=36809 RepID=UPI001878EF7D
MSRSLDVAPVSVLRWDCVDITASARHRRDAGRVTVDDTAGDAVVGERPDLACEV